MHSSNKIRFRAEDSRINSHFIQDIRVIDVTHIFILYASNKNIKIQKKGKIVYAIIAYSFLSIPLNVLHKLEIGAFALDLFNRSGREFVDQIAKDHAIPQDVLEITRRQFLPDYRLDPGKDLSLLFLVATL